VEDMPIPSKPAPKGQQPPATIIEEEEEEEERILEAIPFLVKKEHPKIGAAVIQIPQPLTEEEEEEQLLTPVPDFDPHLPSLPQALALVAGPAEPRSSRHTFSTYPPAYLQKLLGMTREQLSDPK
jgi:hypothetical protein